MKSDGLAFFTDIHWTLIVFIFFFSIFFFIFIINLKI